MSKRQVKYGEASSPSLRELCEAVRDTTRAWLACCGDSTDEKLARDIAMTRAGFNVQECAYILEALDRERESARAETVTRITERLYKIAREADDDLSSPAGQANFVHYQGVVMGIDDAVTELAREAFGRIGPEVPSEEQA